MADAHGASDAGSANEQATTTTFDVIESQAILKQLTGNAGGIYRTEQQHLFARVLGVFRRWLRLGRDNGASQS